MFKICKVAFLLFLPWFVGGQTELILKPVHTLFDAMRAHDSTTITGLFAPGASLTIIEGDTVAFRVSNLPVQALAGAAARARPHVWDERIWSIQTHQDGPLARVWLDYGFYIDDSLTHCGVDDIQLVRLQQGWLIKQITDTRHKPSYCAGFSGGAVVQLLDRWHYAAAVADEDTYFGLMAPDAVFLGTDATERWTRDQMRVWSQSYFDRSTAWDFKGRRRHVTLSPDRRLAWFDEELETWMGPCRGSGVAQLNTAGRWEITHYVLSVAVPNDVTMSYIELLKKMPVPPVIRDRE